MPDIRQPARGVYIGPDGNDISRAVQSVVIEDHDRLADKLTVRLDDSLHLAADALRVGQNIKAMVGWESGESAILFEGRIQETQAHDGAGSHEMVVTALDLSTMMHQEAKSRTHPPGKLSDVLRNIIATYPLMEMGQIEAEPDPQWEAGDPNLTQTNLTDLQFIQALAVRNRARAFVEYCAGSQGDELASRFFYISESKLAGQPAGATLRCCGGFHELLEFRLRQQMNSASPYRPSAVMDPVAGTPVTQEAFPDPPDAPASTNPDREQAADAQGTGDAYRAAMTTAASAETQPSAMVQQLRAAGLPSDPGLAQAMSQRDPTTIRGLRARALAVGNIHLRAKSRVNISGITAYAEGAWYIRLARHKVENGSYTTELILTQ